MNEHTNHLLAEDRLAPFHDDWPCQLSTINNQGGRRRRRERERERERERIRENLTIGKPLLFSKDARRNIEIQNDKSMISDVIITMLTARPPPSTNARDGSQCLMIL